MREYFRPFLHVRAKWKSLVDDSLFARTSTRVFTLGQTVNYVSTAETQRWKEKFIYVTIINEFYAFDLMEILLRVRLGLDFVVIITIIRYLPLEFQGQNLFFYTAPYSSRRQNFFKEPNNSFEKWQKRFVII